MPLATGLNFSSRNAKPQGAGARQGGRIWLLDVPFEFRGAAAAGGAAYDKKLRSYVWKGGGYLPDALLPFAAERYSFQAFREAELNGTPVAPAAPQGSIVPRDYQIACRDAALAARDAGFSGFLIADDVGLGKTIETWDAALAMRDVETVLVICPLAAIAAWRKTIIAMGDGGKRVVVINYDRLKALFEIPDEIKAKMAKRKKGRRKATKRRVRTLKGVARFGEAMEFDLVIVDECQKVKNPGSARSQLVVSLRDESDFTLWLSATAGQNPLELSYLSSVLSDATGDSKKEIDDYPAWCRAQGIGVSKGAFGRIEWKGDGEDLEARRARHSDLELIRSLLFEQRGDRPLAAIRRVPQDIAGWPSISRILMPVDLSVEDRILYGQAWDDFRESAGLQAGARRASGSKENPFVAALRFRQKASLLRTASTVDFVCDQLEAGNQVAVSCFFRESSAQIVEALSSAGFAVTTIDGSLSPSVKEANRVLFQTGSADVVVYSVMEAINLHEGEMPGGSRSRSNVIHDLRHSSIEMKQIEGRTHRDGKFSRAYWMCAADTVEEAIAEVVASRLESMSIMQGDDDTARAVQEILERYAR